MNLLILAYRFPPMGGVGTRRWAKFAKYFSRKNVNIHVLTLRNPEKGSVNWYSDIDGLENLTVHTFNPPNNRYILKNKNNYLTRINNRIKREFRIVIGIELIDYAEKWAKNVIEEAKIIIDRYDIDTIIATGPPASVHLHAAILKTERPDVKLIQDYRDPWNSHRNYELGKYHRLLSTKNRSLQYEQFALNIADKIVVVSKRMQEQLVKSFGTDSSKVSVIYNGFDRDDFLRFNEKSNKNRNNKIEFIYAGTISPGRKEGIELFLSQLKEIGNKNCILHLYSNLKKNSFLPELNEYCAFHDFIDPKLLLEKINSSDICLSVNDKRDSHAFGTKIFEYLALNKPVLHISEGGELYELLKEYGMFVSDYSKTNLKKAIIKTIDKDLENVECDFNDFSLDHLSEKYIRIIEELK